MAPRGHRNPWTDADSDRLVKLHGDGKSLHSIAGEMVRSKQTVGKYAKQLGLVWDRARTAKATEAVVIDNKARRAALDTRLLMEADLVLDQMWQPTVVFSFGGANNTYSEHTLDKPSPSDQKAIMQTASTAVNAAAKLSDADGDSRDLPAVDAWLVAMVPDKAEG